jgi:hypothetical protein
VAFHPIALAGAFVLQAAVANGLGPASFARPLVAAVVAGGLLIGLLWLVVRNAALAALLVTGILLLVISHEPVLAILTAVKDEAGEPWTLIAIGAAAFIPLVLVAIVVDQLRRGHLHDGVIKRPTALLNVFSAVLLAVIVLPALSSDWFGSHAPVAVDEEAGTADHPDIYLILLDGYSRSDELTRQFGMDNTAFTTELARRGFDVDPDSRTNYTYTALTLTSLLSMDYVDAGANGIVSEVGLREQLDEAMTGGAAFRALRSAGYSLVATDAGWEHVALRSVVDRYISRPEMNDFERSLLARTWLPDIPPIPRTLFFDNLRSRIEGILADAAAVAADDGGSPTFTFVHVPSPHLPLAFNADGSATPYDSRQYLAGRASEFGLTAWEYADAYAANLAHLNRLVLEAVDAIRSASDSDPVIVIMSDHGYNGDSPVHGESMLRSLFAAYTPGQPGLLERSPTPVNLMRVLLEGYLGADVGDPVPERFFTTMVSGAARAYDLALTEVEDP